MSTRLQPLIFCMFFVKFGFTLSAIIKKLKQFNRQPDLISDKENNRRKKRLKNEPNEM